MRRQKENKISLFNLLVFLIAFAGVIVFFVYNIIAVNTLAVDINNARNEIVKNITLNNTLQTEIERLSSYDNLKPAAVDKLQMKIPGNKPKKIVVGKSELESSQK